MYSSRVHVRIPDLTVLEDTVHNSDSDNWRIAGQNEIFITPRFGQPIPAIRDERQGQTDWHADCDENQYQVFQSSWHEEHPWMNVRSSYSFFGLSLRMIAWTDTNTWNEILFLLTRSVFRQPIFLQFAKWRREWNKFVILYDIGHRKSQIEPRQTVFVLLVISCLSFSPSFNIASICFGSHLARHLTPSPQRHRRISNIE